MRRCVLLVSADTAPRGTNRMLKKSASIVLASLRGSTYRSVRLASSLAAALPDGLFEHPDVFEAVAPSVIFHRCFICKPSFSQPAKRFGPVLLRFTFHLSRLTPLIEQFQRRDKALRPPLAEHILKLST